MAGIGDCGSGPVSRVLNVDITTVPVNLDNRQNSAAQKAVLQPGRNNMQTTVSRELLLQLLDNNDLISWFQPIFSRQNGEIYGYEALARIREGVAPNLDIAKLFKKAQEEGIIATLDMQCRENAFYQAKESGFLHKNAYIFVNICPPTLVHPDHRGGLTDQLAEKHEIPRERIILEITEQESIKKYDLFQRSIEHYRKRGYKTRGPLMISALGTAA